MPERPPAALSTRSYWLGLDAYEPGPPLQGDLEADVAIVGGGFCGLWTAYHLLEADPGASVAVLESSAIGYGASGRNGGFAMTLLHRGLGDLVEAVGADGAKVLHEQAVASVEAISRVCRREGIEADLQPNGLFTVSNSPLQDEILRREWETAERLGLEGIRYLEGPEIRERIRSETFRAALREKACTLVNPARLVRGLARVVGQKGGQVLEQTPMERFETGPAGVEVETPGGRVRAKRLVLAANAYGAQLPALRGRLLPFYSYILLSEPLSDAQWARVGWAGREGLEDRRTFLHYARPTVDGRILWGGRDAPYRPDGPDPRYDRDARVFRRLEETFAWTFPQLDDLRFEQRWGGPIAVTADLLPKAGWLERGRVAFAAGFAGHGVAITHLVSRALRDLLLERDTAETRLPLLGPPPASLGPRPVRDLLVRLGTAHALRQDDTGRSARPPAVLRLLERLGRRRPRRGRIASEQREGAARPGGGAARR